jgi:hypothetical protein
MKYIAFAAASLMLMTSSSFAYPIPQRISCNGATIESESKINAQRISEIYSYLVINNMDVIKKLNEEQFITTKLLDTFWLDNESISYSGEWAESGSVASGEFSFCGNRQVHYVPCDEYAPDKISVSYDEKNQQITAAFTLNLDIPKTDTYIFGNCVVKPF